MKQVSTAYIRDAHRGHFFDRETMLFFQSRLEGPYAYGSGDGTWYFVTSERYGDEPRLYTVRKYTEQAIETVGEFQAYKTFEQAIAVARNEAR